MGHGCLQQASIIAVVSSEGSGVGSRAHQEEGAQGCLFLMVASEHSASDVSQSESPKCSGFWAKRSRNRKGFKHWTAHRLIQHIMVSSKTLMIILQNIVLWKFAIMKLQLLYVRISKDSWMNLFVWVSSFKPGNFYCQQNAFDLKYFIPSEIWSYYFNNITTHSHVRRSFIMMVNGHMICR